jgi:glycerol-3-phosphate dehydrogenase
MRPHVSISRVQDQTGGFLMKRFIEKPRKQIYDVIVIGGGITGAAVAYEAAGSGLSVALVEKKDFGSGTSAVTSKLIHGGLRYLATGEFGLVRESLHERRIMENIAPNFIYPLPTVITTSRTGLKDNSWKVRIGMFLYDLLSFDRGRVRDRSKKLPGHRTLSRTEVIKMEPNVRRRGLRGASLYYDCIMISPERLTLAFIKSAVRYGADVANYAEVTDFICNEKNGRVRSVDGVTVKDLLSGRDHKIRGRAVINCAGPWADIVLGKAMKRAASSAIRRSEGIHIITKNLLNGHAIATMTPGGRHFFVIPWRNHSLIGTTDRDFKGTPDEYRVMRHSIEELLDEVNQSFGNGDQLVYGDVRFCYGGLRPLVTDSADSVYKTSRKYEIFDNERDGLPGVFTVEGGKYTTSRNLARKVMKTVNEKLKWKVKPLDTAGEYLSGCEIPDMEAFVADCKKRYPALREHQIDYLSRNYGAEIDALMEMAAGKPELTRPLNRDGEMAAQVLYAIRNEMARTLCDILFRRTGLGTLGYPGSLVLRTVADIAGAELRWSDKKKREEISLAARALAVPR